MKASKEYLKIRNRTLASDVDSRFSNDKFFNEYIDGKGYDVLWVSEPNIHNYRIERQQGSFLISANDGVRISTLIESDIYRDCGWVQYVIDGNLWKTAYSMIRKSNISAKSIYGDLGGLARTIRMELSIYSQA